MAKQALGIYASNFHLRLDTRGHILHYPQSPLVQTRAMEIIGFDKRPAGQHFVVGFMSFHGFNIEDALIINKCSIERGLGRSTFFRTYEAEERKYPGGVMDKFETPASNMLGVQQSESYSQLGEDGIIDPEREVEPNDVLIGRTSPPKYTKSYERYDDESANVRRDTSIKMRPSEQGIVDTVILTENVDGNKLVKIKVRDLRVPELETNSHPARMRDFGNDLSNKKTYCSRRRFSPRLSY